MLFDMQDLNIKLGHLKSNSEPFRECNANSLPSLPPILSSKETQCLEILAVSQSCLTFVHILCHFFLSLHLTCLVKHHCGMEPTACPWQEKKWALPVALRDKQRSEYTCVLPSGIHNGLPQRYKDKTMHTNIKNRTKIRGEKKGITLHFIT